MHSGAVDGAAKQLLKGDESVPVVQVPAAENLVRPVTQLRQEESGGRLGSRERRSDAQRLAKMPPRQLHRRLEDRVARRPDARLREAALRFRVQQLAQRAKVRDQSARQLDRATPPGAG